jgi:hypothetical protein
MNPGLHSRKWVLVPLDVVYDTLNFTHQQKLLRLTASNTDSRASASTSASLTTSASNTAVDTGTGTFASVDHHDGGYFYCPDPDEMVDVLGELVQSGKGVDRVNQRQKLSYYVQLRGHFDAQQHELRRVQAREQAKRTSIDVPAGFKQFAPLGGNPEGGLGLL